MIQLSDIEKVMPALHEVWIDESPEGRYSSGDGVSFQASFLERESHINFLKLINSLEDVSDKTIIDLGCEAGLWSVILSQKFKKVIGIDLEDYSIRNANRTLDVFNQFGFDVSNIQFEHCFYNKFGKEKFYKGDQILPLEFDAVFVKDSVGTSLGIEFFDKYRNTLLDIDMLIRTDREDFTKPLEDREKYLIEARNKYKELNFNTLIEFQSMAHCRTADIFVARKDG